MKPLPEGLPPLPEGAVYLGPARSFKRPSRRQGKFMGLGFKKNLQPDWVRGGCWAGDVDGWHYAAPADSEIARLNLSTEHGRPESVDDLSRKWYACPGYRGGPEPLSSPHVCDSEGELVCTCETLEIAEHIAAQHNIWLSYQKHRVEREGDKLWAT